ncbi:MAG: ROK family protein [Planctomycetota bacterium]
MKHPVAIGIDLGGTNLRTAIVDLDGLIVTRSDQPTLADRGFEAVIEDIVASVDALIGGANVDRGSITGVGLCTPGPLDLREGRIIHAANLPGWTNVPIRDALKERLHLPVALENDGNAAALGEYRAGAGRGNDPLVMLTLGTGVGAGVILNGRILHGHFDNAAELGHMIVVVDGLPCPCGQRGCLERYASADAVVRRILDADQNRDRHGAVNVAPPLVGGADPSRERKRPDVPLRAEDVAQAAVAGDPLCRRVWDEACLYLAVACVDIQHAYNPQRIILGGGLANAGDFLLDAVRARFRERTWTLHDDAPEIVLAQLGPDAGLIGSAALALDPG